MGQRASLTRSNIQYYLTEKYYYKNMNIRYSQKERVKGERELCHVTRVKSEKSQGRQESRRIRFKSDKNQGGQEPRVTRVKGEESQG